MKPLLLIVSIVVIQAGCQNLPVSKEDSPYFRVPVGSKLMLNRNITVPAFKAGVYLQGGQVLSYQLVDQYHPHCKFEVRRPKDNPQHVKADEFIITKVRKERDYGASLPFRVASFGVFSASALSPISYATIMYIGSAAQPDVMMMTCSHWEDPADADHLTVSQMRRALGAVFSLNLAE